MWDFIGGMFGLAVRSLLIGWLAAAIFWAIAGAAIAAWGRLPVVVGALVGGLLPVVGAVALAAVAGARRSTELAAVRVPAHQSQLPGAAGEAGGWQQPGWPAQSPAQPGQQPWAPQQGWSGQAGWSAQPGWAASQNPVAPAPTAGQPAWGQQPGWGHAAGRPSAPGGPAMGQQQPAVPTRAAGAGMGPALLLGGLGLVVAAFLAGLFLVWVRVPNYGDYGAFGVPSGALVIFTLLVLAAAAALSLRTPRRWVAVLVAWFCSWWLVIGLAATTATQRFADLLAASTDATQGSAGGTTILTNELGPGAYLVFVAAVLGLLWAVAVLTLIDRGPTLGARRPS